MFGSNFPVDKLHSDYTSIWMAYEKISSGLDDRDQQQLFGDTARAFYSIV
jgi:predicted TIM-barrel fold metal-dependent hydrolase